MNDFVRDRGGVGGSTAEAAATSDYRIREVEARLDRRLVTVEAQRGRSRWATGLTVLALLIASGALGIAVWAVAPREGARTMASLSTREVVLRDADGVERGRLATDADGSQLSLSDREGRERIRLTVLPDGSPGRDDQRPGRTAAGRSRLSAGRNHQPRLRRRGGDQPGGVRSRARRLDPGPVRRPGRHDPYARGSRSRRRAVGVDVRWGGRSGRTRLERRDRT